MNPIQSKSLPALAAALAAAVLTTIPARGAPWTPADLPDKALWLDAADSGTITLNGSTVSQWNDKSGNGRNVAQSNAAKQPTYATGYLNGNNAISFDGTGRSLSAGTATINLSQPFNRFIVGKFLTKSSQSVIVDGNNGSGAGGQQVFYNGESAGSWRMACDATYKNSISYGTSDFNNHIHFHNLNGASTYYSIDGATTLSGPGNSGSIGQPGICIGNIRNEVASGYGFQGYVYEIILTTGTLSPADRQKTEGYLAWKWGTQASLPVGHPYESAAPVISEATPPTIATLNPTDEATGVLTYANLSATFSESIQKGTGNITLKKSADNSTVETFDVATSPRITVSGATLTIDPTGYLDGNTGYYVEIDATAVKDMANNFFAGIADTTTWNFTTGVADTTAPTIATLSPADDATGADLVANLVATFDENIQKGTGFITLKKTADNSEVETFDVATSPRITVSGATLTIDPTGTLVLATGYYVQIDPAAIQDLSGNSFAGIADSTTWNFTTTSSITVLNPSFQSNVVADGAVDYVADNWTLDHFTQSSGRITWNPSGYFTGDGGNGTPLGADQSQVFTIFGGDSSSGARLYQDTTSPLAAGTTYTLTVAVGRRLSGDAASWGIEIMTTSQTPGSQYLARLTGTYTDLTAGEFVDKTVTFTPTFDHPNLGQNLRVHLWSQGIDGSHTSTAFDNVRLGTAADTETILPTLVGIVDDKSGGPVEMNTLVTYTVTFSEDMDADTVSDADFGNAGTATFSVGTVTETTPGVFTVPVTPTSTGTLQLQIKAGAVLRDLAGNALDTTSAIADDTIITVNTSGGYAAWQATNGTAGTIDQDHDADGVPNGIEYFLGGTTGFTALPGVTNTGGTLSITWTRHPDYPGFPDNYGTDFVVETSATLTGPWTEESSPGNVTITGNDVTYTFPSPLGAKKFARLKVTGP